jgi:proline iminopeptidase
MLTTRKWATALTVMMLSFRAIAAQVPQSSEGVAVEQQEGYVVEAGVSIYYKSIGHGRPLMVLHGGPGGSHDTFLPYLIPLAVRHRLIFIDERGSGKSSRPDDDASYTLDAMTGDVEAVRRALHLGRIDMLGHSFGGIVAQAYAIAYPKNVTHLILASTWSSAERINSDFAKIRHDADPSLTAKLDQMEAQGIFDSSGAQLPEYRKAADAVEGPYDYFIHRPSWDEPSSAIGWRVLKAMWCGRSDFHVDGTLAGFDFASSLEPLDVRTLIIYGDHDLVQSQTAEVPPRDAAFCPR